jgi:hypothetical protein
VNGLPSRDLELKAAEERRRLDRSLRKLRARLEYDLNFKNRIRGNLGIASALTALASLAAGYWITGEFLR